jgi:hypothetical protein
LITSATDASSLKHGMSTAIVAELDAADVWPSRSMGPLSLLPGPSFDAEFIRVVPRDRLPRLLPICKVGCVLGRGSFYITWHEARLASRMAGYPRDAPAGYAKFAATIEKKPS